LKHFKGAHKLWERKSEELTKKVQLKWQLLFLGMEIKNDLKNWTSELWKLKIYVDEVFLKSKK